MVAWMQVSRVVWVGGQGSVLRAEVDVWYGWDSCVPACLETIEVLYVTFGRQGTLRGRGLALGRVCLGKLRDVAEVAGSTFLRYILVFLI